MTLEFMILPEQQIYGRQTIMQQPRLNVELAGYAFKLIKNDAHKNFAFGTAFSATCSITLSIYNESENFGKYHSFPFKTI